MLLFSGITAPFDLPEAEVIEIAKTKMKRVCSSAAGLHFRLYKKSIDARKRGNIKQVVSVLVTADGPLSFDVRALAREGGCVLERVVPTCERGCEKMAAPPLVVGMGPAGLFAALWLAEHGFSPILIDRGDDVAARARATARFAAEGVLDTESNIQFGAGGAGTFSDGKLVTRVNDALCDYVLERLIEFGAPREIAVKAKPHVGTDILRVVVENMLRRIISLGGCVLYRTRLLDFTERDGGVVASTTAGEIKAGVLVLAIGHSARDTFAKLMEKQLAIEPKPFSVGVRIEHLQEDIDKALFGDAAGHPMLGPAEYALADTTGERGVYTFCMCPGGEVVAAASETGGVVVNGMSYHARNGKNANAAMLVSVTPADTGGSVEGGIAFQRELERAAFRLGGEDYRAPVQTVGDFLAGKQGSEPTRVQPTYGGGRVTLTSLAAGCPDFVSETLSRGLLSFDKKIAGFAAPCALLTGFETRTSSPLRILRGEARTAIGRSFLYPVGEGAGYAGGITSAALDGLRSAMAIVSRFAPPKQ